MHRFAESSFTSLVEQHHAQVWALCLAILEDPGLADEALQDVFVTLWRRGGTIEASRVGAWLRQVARHRAIDIRRRRKREERLHDAVAVPPAQSRRSEAPTHVAMAEALARLSEPDREILIRFHLDEVPSRVVAQELGLSDSATRKRLSRAREALRGAYEAELRTWARPLRRASAVAVAVLALRATVARANPLPVLGGVGVVMLLAVGAAFVLWPERGESRPSTPDVPLDLVVKAPDATPASFDEWEEALRADRVPFLDVECELSEPVRGMELLELDPNTEAVIGPVVVYSQDFWISFRPRHPLGLGWLRTHRHEPVPIAWGEGACLRFIELVPLPNAIVRGQVEGPIGLDDTFVVAKCGMHLAPRVDLQGYFYLELPFDETTMTTCPFVAYREFGNDSYQSNVVEVRPSLETPTDILLVLPDLPPAGWSLFDTGDVLRIMDVEADGPAANAGLRSADRVVAIDGDPVANWDVFDARDLEPPFQVTLEGQDGLRTVRVE
ncbi:MAG: sigma-70 family RNA polymerase sigma factor [Myxococcota bacterium]